MKLTPFDRALNRVLRAELNYSSDDLPDIAMVMKAFEQDAAAYSNHGFNAHTVAATIAKVIVGLLAAMLIYLLAIMLIGSSNDSTHISEPTLAPDATALPELSLPGLMGYEMIDAGHQLAITDFEELKYYFSLPVAALSSPDWSISSMYVRDERGVDGLQTRAVNIIYSNALGETVTVSSLLPGSEAATRLEDEMRYAGSAEMLGLEAAKLTGNGISRIYTLRSRAAYAIEASLSIDDLAEIAPLIVAE